MFDTEETTYTFGIETYPEYEDQPETPEQQHQNQEQLRAVWTGHLVNEQDRVTKEQIRRHPLELALNAKFNGLIRDDRSILLHREQEAIGA